MAELIDLTGKRFGKLVVLSKGESRRTSGGQFKATWICKCDCGNTTTVDAEKLRNGRTRSCGCAFGEVVSQKKRKDITGQRFGRLIVVKFIPMNERDNRDRQWLCKCDCGNYVQVNGTKLRSGHTNSCGCLIADRTRETCQKFKHQDKRMYQKYHGIMQRCYDVGFRKYSNYGGRGIRVCDEWADKDTGFDAFYEWAVQNGYSPELTIDRIDVNGNYCPENCRWITNQENQNNKRTNVFLTYNGETHSMTEWSRILNIPYTTIRYHVRYKRESLTEFMNSYTR